MKFLQHFNKTYPAILKTAIMLHLLHTCFQTRCLYFHTILVWWVFHVCIPRCYDVQFIFHLTMDFARD